MSLFPAIDGHITTITQPELPPPDDKHKISIGRRILASTKHFGKSKCDFIHTMIRGFRRHRRIYTCWMLVGCIAFILVYITNSFHLNWGISEQSKVYRRSNDDDIDNALPPSNNNFVVETADDFSHLSENLPELPIQPPARAFGRPLILHYVWCGQRLFEFRHYLSVKSASRIIAPYKILFHYVDLPLQDTEGYFTWFNQTLKEVPDIILHKLDRTICPSSGTNRFLLILDLLHEYGGVYVPDDVLLLHFPGKLRTVTFVSNVVVIQAEDYKEGIIVAKARGFLVPTDSEHLYLRLTSEDPQTPKLSRCVSTELYEKTSNHNIMCAYISRMIFPKDIWAANTKFAMMARVIAYNKLNIQPTYDLTHPLPKIGHYICVGTCEIEFITFISMLSAVFLAKLDRVYVHGPQTPSGQWWAKLQEDARFVYVKHVPTSYNTDNVHSLTRDPCPLRIEILLRYGGVYQDGNVLWTNQIPDYYFGYEAVVSPDWHLYGNWPDSINPSVLMGKQGSRYLTKLYKALKSPLSAPNWFYDHYSAYKIIELEPESVFVDRRLQVKCLNHNCHPTWLPDYRSEIHQNKPGSFFQWRNDTLSVQWEDSVPKLDLDMIKYLSGTPVEISRQVFQAANIDVNSL
ncbi:hypothetical protein SNE40_013608 [Patella caerulea]|uniref:Uncharacterized protein n=1 Tax=Patella caerulea TaxID=87958 RepID=A0AAN8JGB1_PATCE